MKHRLQFGKLFRIPPYPLLKALFPIAFHFLLAHDFCLKKIVNSLRDIKGIGRDSKRLFCARTSSAPNELHAPYVSPLYLGTLSQ